MDTHILKSEALSKRSQKRIRRNLFEAFLEALEVSGKPGAVQLANSFNRLTVNA